MFFVLAPLQKSSVYQMIEPACEHGGSNIKTLLHVIETSVSKDQDVAQDQWCPPLANNLKRLGDWAIHVLESLPLHSL
jgi:hypothetical protein